MTKLPGLLILVLAALISPVQAENDFTIVSKTLETVPESGNSGDVDIPAAETPGYQRFRIGTPPETEAWAVIMTTPGGHRFEINASTLPNYLAYDDVIEVPVWEPGNLSIEKLGAAPGLKRVSVVVRLPDIQNKFPQGDFNLVPESKWSGSQMTQIKPGMALLKTSSVGPLTSCSATQIAPQIFLTAAHCISPVVDASCQLKKNAGQIRLYFGANLIESSGQPTPQAIVSSTVATPVFCGIPGADDHTPGPFDFAVVLSQAEIAGSNIVPPETASLTAGTELLLAAYLSLPASGRRGNDQVEYPPGLYASRDSDCKVPPLQAQAFCPAGHVPHLCNSWPTMSGGAVFRGAGTQLVAVHYFGSQYLNCAVPWATILQRMKVTATTSLQKEVLSKVQ